MHDCQRDLHMSCRQTLSVYNAVTKQLWEEENERGTPSEGSWSPVADGYSLENYAEMSTWGLFQPQETFHY